MAAHRLSKSPRTSQEQPSEPPPPYLQVPGNPALHRTHSDTTAEDDDHYQSEIPHDERRSMEDAFRELPDGWVRQFDEGSGHQFFVDTKAKPPRSIWVHPYDEPEFLSTLPKDHPARQSYRPPSGAPPSSASSSHSASQSTSSKGKEKPTFGRKMKDKLTGSTHEEREAKRAARAKAEKEAYERYLQQRQAIIEQQRNSQGYGGYSAPMGPYSRGGYYDGYGGGYCGGSGYGYGGRSMYGGGGMGMGMPLMGGLMGGMLLGDMMGGGF